MAKLHDGQGAEVGEVELRQGAGEVHGHAKLFSLPGGAYVLVVHDRGQCLPGFQAVGPELVGGPEISLSVGGDGGAESEFATAGFTVARLKDWDGSSFLLSPAAAPNRPLACGVVEE